MTANAPTNGPLPAAGEANNKQRLQQLLEPHFTVIPEVWIREPMRGMTVRLDFAAVTPDTLLDAGFPFDVLGIEVKTTGLDGRVRRHALGQCFSYRGCVFVDRRLPKPRGLFVPAVALYTADRSRYGELSEKDAFYGEVRLAGTQSVGVLVHHPRDGLQLELAAERIWNQRRGVTGVGSNWPSARRFANSTRRTT